MEKNAILAFVLSMAVFAVYFLFFAPSEPKKPPQEKSAKEVTAQKESPSPVSPTPAAVTSAPPAVKKAVPGQPAKDIAVKTGLFEAVFSEYGGSLKSFKLTAYKEQLGGKDSKELILSDQPATFPLQMEWIKNSLPEITQARFIADKTSLSLSPSQPKGTVSFRWTSKAGVFHH